MAGNFVADDQAHRLTADQSDIAREERAPVVGDAVLIVAAEIASAELEGCNVLQKEGAQDRRQRLLSVTSKGEALALKLASLQTQRINRAFGELGPNAHEAARRFLTSMIDTDNCEDVLRLIARADRASTTRG